MSFSCDIQEDGDKMSIIIGGAIDEDVKFPQLNTSGFNFINFDFQNLALINSCGIREWVIWLRTIPVEIQVSYFNCPRVLIEQINMIDGLMTQNGNVGSFYLPYYCEECDDLTLLLCEKDKDYSKGGFEPKEYIKCGKCGENAEIDIIESKYLKFINLYG